MIQSQRGYVVDDATATILPTFSECSFWLSSFFLARCLTRTQSAANSHWNETDHFLMFHNVSLIFSPVVYFLEIHFCDHPCQPHTHTHTHTPTAAFFAKMMPSPTNASPSTKIYLWQKLSTPAVLLSGMLHEYQPFRLKARQLSKMSRLHSIQRWYLIERCCRAVGGFRLDCIVLWCSVVRRFTASCSAVLTDEHHGTASQSTGGHENLK